MSQRIDSAVAAIFAALVGVAACGGRAMGGIPMGAAGAGTAGAAGATTSGSGGAGGGAACPGGSVNFQFVAWRPEAGAPVDYCVDCCIDCDGPFSIRTELGLPISRGLSCQTNCDGCSLPDCNLGLKCGPGHLPASGWSTSWDGTYFTQGVCGAGIQCAQPTCPPAGSHFVATLCASPSAGPSGPEQCASSGPAQCVDVPFDYPATGPVVGVLYPSR